MPIEVGLWRLGEKLESISFSPIDSEKRLEDVLFNNIEIIGENLLLIGRQVLTGFGKFIDLLAIDADGQLVVLELKRNQTPREIVAQLLDYGSWVRSLQREDVEKHYAQYLSKYRPSKDGATLEQAYCDYFRADALPDEINESHKLVLVASELDESSERIINYLSDEYGVAINAVFFRFFRDGDREYLSRAWLIDPTQIEAKVQEMREKLPWNGEYYASFGGDDTRDWEEARKFGFISAGGKPWYWRTLNILEPGGRVWVNIPGGTGYVGVGTVLEESVPIDDFLVSNGHGGLVPISKVAPKAAQHTSMAQDPDRAERFVRVEWIKTVPIEAGVREKGLFGNQNSAAKPRSEAWVHTVARLKERFGVSES